MSKVSVLKQRPNALGAFEKSTDVSTEKTLTEDAAAAKELVISVQNFRNMMSAQTWDELPVFAK